METFVQNGKRLAHTNATSTTIASGDVVLLTNRIGVAVADIAASEAGEVEVEGVHTLAKTAGEAWTLGQQLYWDASALSATSTSGANAHAGYAAAIADSADTTGPVKLNV